MKDPSLFDIRTALLLGSCMGLLGCTGTSEEAPQRPADRYRQLPAAARSHRLPGLHRADRRRRFGPGPGPGHGLSGEDLFQGGCGGQGRHGALRDRPAAVPGRRMTPPRPRSPRTWPASNWPSRTTRGSRRSPRTKPGAVTQVDLDKYQSQEDQAVANLDYARANLETAKLNLDWTKVTAPVTGLIGRLLVTRGNLIVANQTTLTTIVRQDPMWVYFDVDEPTVLQVQELIRQGKFGPAATGRLRRSRSTSSWPTRRASRTKPPWTS